MPNPTPDEAGPAVPDYERLYRPSNGTEGMGFMDIFCHECVKDRGFRFDTGPGCPLAAAALMFTVDNPNYPQEWTYDALGKPTCTAFVQDNDNDADGEPPPPPPDPSQLVLIADPTEDAAAFGKPVPEKQLVTANA